jgi:predicted acyltransferase
MIYWGAGLLVAGLIFGHSGLCPIIKRIWTPSFALICTGCCILILSAFYSIVDLVGFKRWTYPLVVIGSNSIAVYCLTMTMRPWTKATWGKRFSFKPVICGHPPCRLALSVLLFGWLLGGYIATKSSSRYSLVPWSRSREMATARRVDAKPQRQCSARLTMFALIAFLSTYRQTTKKWSSS